MTAFGGTLQRKRPGMTELRISFTLCHQLKVKCHVAAFPLRRDLYIDLALQLWILPEVGRNARLSNDRSLAYWPSNAPTSVAGILIGTPLVSLSPRPNIHSRSGFPDLAHRSGANDPLI